MSDARAKLLSLAIATFVIGALGLGWRASEQHAIATHAAPPPPGSLTGELADKIARASETARGFLRPATGLAELSRLYHANGFFTEAGACYDGLEKLEPKNALWPHLQANILAGFGRLEEARPLEERAVALMSNYLPAALRLGDIQLKDNQAAAAEKTYAAVLRRDAANRYALLGLAKCDLAAGRWPEARDRLRQALVGAPDFVGALSLLVTVAEHFGEAATADEFRAKIGKREFVDFPDPWLDELSASCHDPYRLSVVAAAALAAGDAASARRWLERAITLDATAGTYRRQLGKLFFQARDFAPAREQLEQAVRLTPGDSDAWALLVEILGAQGDTTAANRALADGLKQCPQSPVLHYTAGHRLSEAGRFAAAITELKAAQALRPNEVNAGIDLAMIYFRDERIEEAVAELQAVLAAQPGHPLAMEVLARHAINSHDERAARGWLRELRLQPRVAPDDLKTIIGEYQQQFGRLPPP